MFLHCHPRHLDLHSSPCEQQCALEEPFDYAAFSPYLDLSAIPSSHLGNLTGLLLTLVVPVDLQFFGAVENDVFEGPSEICPCPLHERADLGTC